MILVNEPLLNGNEKKYLTECIDTNWISSEGPFIKKFESAMADYVNRKHGIAVCNGTAALELAIRILNLEPGSEIIMPSFTIISCAAAIIRNNCVPVLVDSDPDTWNINISQIEKKITSKTKAIMVVHIYGLPVDMNPIIDISKKYGLKIIEDAAEMHGQCYNGKKCGSFGDVSIFSFYPNKHITTGEGGMVLTDDDNLAERAKSFRNLCFKAEKRFEHDELGYNFRMTNLQAALGLAQVEQIENFIQIKRNMGLYYNEKLKNIKGLQLPLVSTEYAENIYWVFGIVLKNEIDYDASVIMKKLAELKIATRPFFVPMHKQPVLNKMGLFINENYPVSEKIAARGFYIPSGMALTKNQMDEVVSAITKIIQNP